METEHSRSSIVQPQPGAALYTIGLGEAGHRQSSILPGPMIEEITLGLHRYSYLLQQASPPLWSDLTRHHGSPALLALQPPERKLRRCGHPTARISRSSNLKRYGAHELVPPPFRQGHLPCRFHKSVMNRGLPFPFPTSRPPNTCCTWDYRQWVS